MALYNKKQKGENMFTLLNATSSGNGGSILEGLILVTIIILGIFLFFLSIVALFYSIKLAISYHKFNRQKVKSGITGKECARKLLDENDLQKIKVKKSGLFMSFVKGNSYSHYFKNIRLRNKTFNKPSLSSVAMAGEKVGLAILDKEKDPDMVKRIKLVPIVSFGPFFFIVIVGLGLLLDIFIFKTGGVVSIIATVLSILFYIWIFFLALRTLKTEKKAQEKALIMLRSHNYLDDDEIEDAKKLYRLYNINYKIELLIALIQAIIEILKIVLKIMEATKKSSNSN